MIKLLTKFSPRLAFEKPKIFCNLISFFFNPMDVTHSKEFSTQIIKMANSNINWGKRSGKIL